MSVGTSETDFFSAREGKERRAARPFLGRAVGRGLGASAGARVGAAVDDTRNDAASETPDAEPSPSTHATETTYVSSTYAGDRSRTLWAPSFRNDRLSQSTSPSVTYVVSFTLRHRASSPTYVHRTVHTSRTAHVDAVPTLVIDSAGPGVGVAARHRR